MRERPNPAVSLSNSLKKNVYWNFSLLVIAVELVRVWQGHWIGDFWEHAAVAQELSRRPFSPVHPLLDSGATHAFFSPYSLLVAAFIALFNVTSIHALEFFGVINLLLFIVSFRYLCVAVFGSGKELTYTACLVTSLLLWGKQPDTWSGFHHLYGLHFILPYPSLFAVSLAFIALSLHIGSEGIVARAATTVLAASVLVIHPNTALFLCICLGGAALVLFPGNLKRILETIVILFLSFALAVAWPYYDLWQLFTGDSVQFHRQSLELYDRTAEKYWPLLLVIPAGIRTWHHRACRFLSVATLLLLAVFMLGYASGLYGLGRAIAGAMTTGLMLVGRLLTTKAETKGRWSWYTPAVVAALLVCLAQNGISYVRTLFTGKHDDYYTRFFFLKSHVGADETVLAGRDASWFVPALSGKVVAWPHPLYFVADEARRQEVAARFFDPGKSREEKSRILATYDPDFILLDHMYNALPDSEAAWLRSLGTVRYQKDSLELIALANVPARRAR